MLWLISLLGIVLSIWIIIPTPTMWLLPLGVVTPEISPILALLNAIALILGIAQNHPSKWLALVALFISLLPLIQFYPTNQRFKTEIVRVIGTEYFSKIPQPSPLDIHIERVIALDYRHAPVNNFPAQLEDIQLALSYIANNSDQSFNTPLYGGFSSLGYL